MKTEAEKLEETVVAIYDAARIGTAWGDALATISDLFDANTATLFARNIRTMEGQSVGVGLNVGVNENDSREYFQVWGRRNPFVNARAQWIAGEIKTDEQMLARSELIKTAYFNEYMRRFEADRVLHLSIATLDQTHYSISLSRSDKVGAFDHAEIKRGEALMPHLQRAVATALELEKTYAFQRAAAALLDEQPRGVLFVDRGMRVVFANASALRMAEASDAFRIRNNRIVVVDPAAADKFGRVLDDAINPASHSSRRSGMARLPRSNGGRDYLATVSALDRAPSAFDAARPQAIVAIADPDAGLVNAQSRLRELYGLTSAEARLAERLALGESPEEAALALGVKLSTARWHLASILRKTNSKGQAALMRIVAALR